MLITKDNRDVVRNQVIYLSGCYPQLQWDINITASAWLISLIEIKATEEEFSEIVKYIVKHGYPSHEVNIALIIRLIRDERHNKSLSQYKPTEMTEPQITLESFRKKVKEAGYGR